MLRISATCWSVTGWPLSFWMTSVSGSVRKPGKVLSNSSCAERTELSGGRYFSLMPPSANCPSGMISTIITIDDGRGEGDGPLHHDVDQLAPEALLDLCAGLGLLRLLGEPVNQTIGLRANGPYLASAMPTTTTATKITMPSSTQYSALPMTSASFIAITP